MRNHHFCMYVQGLLKSLVAEILRWRVLTKPFLLGGRDGGVSLNRFFRYLSPGHGRMMPRCLGRGCGVYKLEEGGAF